MAKEAKILVDALLDVENKCFERIEIKVDGTFKDLVILLSKSFSEQPKFFEVVKEAVDFHQFKESMSSTDFSGLSEQIKAILMKENTESKNSKEL